MVVQFFKWVDQQELFYYNIKSCVLIHFLVRENILGPARSILHELIEGKIPTLTLTLPLPLPERIMERHGHERGHAEIVDSLIGKYNTYESELCCRRGESKTGCP
jgi:hypothetical protein